MEAYRRIGRIAKMYANKYPDHKAAIWDLAELAATEIEDGGSEDHEVELMISSIEDELDLY